MPKQNKYTEAEERALTGHSATQDELRRYLTTGPKRWAAIGQITDQESADQICELLDEYEAVLWARLNYWATKLPAEYIGRVD